MDFLDLGFGVVVRIWAIYYQRCKKICNATAHITNLPFRGRCQPRKKIHTMGPDWIIFSTFITLYHLLPAITNDYQGLNVAPEWSYGGYNGDSW